MPSRLLRIALSTVTQSASFALRLARRDPGPTAIAVLTLALGLGATSALFSVIDAWLLRPLPFHDPARLVVVWETIPSAGITQNTPAPASLAAWREGAASFEDLAAWSLSTENLTGGGDPARLRVITASANLLTLLGRTPVLGRNFLPGEARLPGGDVALLSHAFWQRQFSSDAGVLGRTMILNGRAIEIVGVLPPDLPILGYAYDIWRPLAVDAASESRMLWVFGRLRQGITPDAASREVSRIGEARPGSRSPARVAGLHEQTVGPVRRDVLILFTATVLVLVIACANVGGLTMARMHARRQELLVRLSLGCSRGRLAGQVLVESLFISIAGTLVGALFGAWIVRAVVALAPQSERLATVPAITTRVFVFMAAAAAVAAALFGLMPAWHAASTSVAGDLRAGGRALVASRRRFLNVLVIGELALAVALVTSAALVLQSFIRVTNVELGYRPDGLVVFELPRPRGVAATTGAHSFFSSLLERLRGMPGVSGAALSQALPLQSVGSMGGGFVIEGRAGDNTSLLAFWRIVNPGYFQTLEMTLVSGRHLADTDGPGAPRVAVVSQSFARQAWPDQDALGRRIGWGNMDEPLTVVGVVTDVRHSPQSELMPHVYMPFTQVDLATPSHLAVRSNAPTARTVELVRRVVSELDPQQPIPSIATGDDLLARTMGRRRFQLTLVALFASAGAMLALVGIYGVMTFVSGQRLREMSVRLALGATPAAVGWLLIRHGLGLTILGAAAGLLLSSWSSSLLEGFLFGPRDGAAGVLALGAVTLSAAALAACVRPAVSASRAAPADALRAE